MLARIGQEVCNPRNLIRVFGSAVVCLLLMSVLQGHQQKQLRDLANFLPTETIIFVITPTYPRGTRLADMSRFGNTLAHIKNLHWIVVEDGESKVSHVQRLLDRTGLPHTYLAARTIKGYPKRGWYQRDTALEYLRKHAQELTGGRHAVVFFGDDDNSYDIRLFNDYVRNVKRVGIWGVGLVGGIAVECPKVVNGKVVGWSVGWKPDRKFATDMAGFAVGLELILNTTAVFGKSCGRGFGAPEPCFLEDLGITKEDMEPFGFDMPDGQRDVLVWHTKTGGNSYSVPYGWNGYVFEHR